MSLENATQIIWEGQKAIGLKEDDVKKLSISPVSSSSFSVDNSVVQNEVSGGQVPEDHTINTSVIDNGVDQVMSQTSSDVAGGETVSSSVIPEPVVNPVSEEQSNIFDMPQGDAYQSSILQPEVVSEPVPEVNVPVYDSPAVSVPQEQSILGSTESALSGQDMYYQPSDLNSQQEVPSYPVYQEPVQNVQSQFDTPNEHLDTPQTFYEKQDSQDVQGGFSNMPQGEVKSEIPNVNTDPVVIMLDEVMRTVNERSRATGDLNNENQILRSENAELRNENDRLKQTIIELNNKVLIAEAQRQAAEQTLAGARMAENGQARVYQPQQMPQNNYYNQAA